MRGKEPANIGMEHVEVESADGTTQIHPLDEPEDQAVADAQSGNSSALPLNNSEPVAAAPVVPATPSASSPTATAPATTSTAPAHSATTPTAPVAPARTPSAPTATAPVTAPTATTEAAPVPAGSGQVQVQFVADCWTQVTDGNGKVLTSGLKRKGDSIDVNGKPPLTLRLGYARGAQVSYNGQPVDVAPFTSGETARLKLGQ